MGIIGRRKAVKLANDVRDRVENLLKKREPSAGLAQVTIYSEHDFDSSRDCRPTMHIVAVSDLLTFLVATLELHYEPGRNPHNNVPTSPVQAIAVAMLRPSGPYWWATPGLHDNYNDQGAVIFNWDPSPHIVWRRPGVDLPEFLQASAN